MPITRVAFWAMLLVAGIEIYEMVRDQQARPAGVFMLIVSVIAAWWLYFDSPRDPRSE